MLMRMKEVFEMYDHRFGNAGPQISGMQYDSDSDPGTDMNAFNQLGPQTRKYMAQMPVRWSAKKTLDMIRQHGMNPMHPDHDSRVVSMLKQNQVHVSNLLQQQDQSQGLTPRAANQMSAVERAVARSRLGAHRLSADDQSTSPVPRRNY